MKRILVMASLLIAVFIFSGCYTPRGVVRTGGNRYYAPRNYGGFGYHGGAHSYGGGYRSYQGGGYYGGHHR